MSIATKVIRGTFIICLTGNIKVQVNLLHQPTSVNFHQDTVSHILVVHQGMLCLCEFIIGFYIAMLLLNLRMIGDDRSELNLFMQHRPNMNALQKFISKS